MVIPVEKKFRIVLSVLKKEISIAETVRWEMVSGQAIGNWKRQFLEGSRAGIEAGKSKPWEQQLEVEVAGLTRALGEAAVEIRVWKKERGGSSGSFQDLEVIRVEAGMFTVRFCRLIGMPEHTWRRWRTKAKRAKPEWGHRNIWAMTRHDGHKVSQATVLRLLRDHHLILPSELRQTASKAHQKPQSCINETPDRPCSGCGSWILPEVETTSGGI